jgi:hypothetical protein
MNYAVELNFNGMLNFMKVYQLVQKLLLADTQTDRQISTLQRSLF